MKKIINDENIDEIMFSILEGEITGKEKEQLLEAIHAEPAYAELWKLWQQTKIVTDPAIPEYNPNRLKKGQTFIFPVWKKLSMAAAIALLGGLGVIFLTPTENNQNLAFEPAQSGIIQSVPSQNKFNVHAGDSFMRVRDSIVRKKENVRYMAVTVKNESTGRETTSDTFIQQSVQLAETGKSSLPVLAKQDSLPVRQHTVEKSDNYPVLVSVETVYTKEKVVHANAKEKDRSLFSRILGKPSIKIEDEESTKTGKKIIIENEKYQIIAGF